jgi:hypothetical protein
MGIMHAAKEQRSGFRSLQLAARPIRRGDDPEATGAEKEEGESPKVLMGIMHAAKEPAIWAGGKADPPRR